jgi:hypothetical protein
MNSLVLGMVIDPAAERAKPGSIGLARAGGRVDQAMRSGMIGLPRLFLEGEGLPIVATEPGAYGSDAWRTG